MSLDVDVTTDSVRSPLGRDSIAEVARLALRAERVKHALLSITLLDKRAIARLNRTHLGHRGPTDVIARSPSSYSGTVVATCRGQVPSTADVAPVALLMSRTSL